MGIRIDKFHVIYDSVGGEVTTWGHLYEAREDAETHVRKWIEEHPIPDDCDKAVIDEFVEDIGRSSGPVMWAVDYADAKTVDYIYEAVSDLLEE